MLSKLFEDISLASLVRAWVFSLGLAAMLLLLPGVGPSAELSWPYSTWWYWTLLIVAGVVGAWWLNASFLALGFVKRDYQLIPLLSLLLWPCLMAFPDWELLLCWPLGILVILRLLSLSVAPDYSYVLFDAGNLIGLMSIFVPESLILLPVCWLAMLSFGQLFLRGLLMPVVGILAVWFMAFALFFAWGEQSFVSFMLEGFSTIELFWRPQAMAEYWRFIPLLVLLLPALLEITQVYAKADVQKRQTFVFFLLAALVFFLGGGFLADPQRVWLWLNIPLGLFVLNLVHYLRKPWWRDISYLLLLLYVFLIGIGQGFSVG